MNGPIDITTISTLRPDVLWSALISVRDNLRWAPGFRLILDVAPVPACSECCQTDVVGAALRIFPNLISRTNTVSLQAEAQKWVWGRAESEFVVQWEDDWVLLIPVDLARVLMFFEDRPRLAMLFFDRREKPVEYHPGYQGMFEEVEPGFFLRTTAKNFGGPPAVIRRSYLRMALEFMNDNEALDLTCRRPECQAFLEQWEFGVLTDPAGRAGLVEDIGKRWRAVRGLRMRKDTPLGVQWEKV
jgi:hypothetical protein